MFKQLARRAPARPAACAAALGALCLAGGPALAAPEEIQVYRDETTAPGRLGVEVNQNYVISAPKSEAAPALGSVGLYRFTPELDYGFARQWEAGVLLISTVRGGAFDAHGLKAHVRYIAPRPEADPWYWGFNFETGWTDRHLEERPWSAELRGAFGYEGKRWIFAFNPTVETAADARAAEPPSIELQSKVGYRVAERLILGLESYDDLGSTARFGSLRQQSHMLYAAADVELPRGDLNLGVGRGLTGASDGWAVKLVWGLPLGRP